MGHLVDGDPGRRHLVVDGLVQVAADEDVDVTIEGRREQERLAAVVELAQDALDLRHEAHVGHAVGLVDHEHLDVAERDRLTGREVDQASGSGDGHVDDAPERPLLTLDGRAAVEGGDVESDGLGRRHQHVDHLSGELARGHEHERPRAPGRRAALGALEHREPEGQRLARAGRGLAADVGAVERVADGELLNGERFGDVVDGERRHQLGAQAELGEGSQCLLLESCGLPRAFREDNSGER